MNRRGALKILFIVLALSVLYYNETVLAKTKEIDYRKEFPVYLQTAVLEQKIDVNGDGRLSLKEANVVTSLTLKEDKNQDGFYSLDSITAFKNLKKLRLDCKVKSLSPLYSLKKLSVLTLGEEACVSKARTDFSKISNLKTLISKDEVFAGTIDLRKNKKLKFLELPSETDRSKAPIRVYNAVKVYLPDQRMDISGVTNSKYIVNIYGVDKKIKTDMFFRKASEAGRKEMEKWVSKHTCTEKLYLLKGKNYSLNKLDLVSGSSGKSLQKAARGKSINWKCSDKNVRIQKGKVRFSKPGSYTLIGYAVNRRYIVNLYVIESKFGGISKNCPEIRIYSSARGIPIYITDPGMIAKLYSKLNTGNFKYKFSCCGESVGNLYTIKFLDADRREVDSVLVMNKYIGQNDLYYTGATEDLWSYITGVYNNSITAAAMG